MAKDKKKKKNKKSKPEHDAVQVQAVRQPLVMPPRTNHVPTSAASNSRKRWNHSKRSWSECRSGLKPAGRKSA